MQAISIARHIKAVRYRSLAILLVLSIVITSPSVRAQDAESIDTLRQMGRAFAAIAEKASPAVVGIKTERTITQNAPALHD